MPVHWPYQNEYAVSNQYSDYIQRLKIDRIYSESCVLAGMKDCVRYQSSNYEYVDFFELKQFKWAHSVGFLIKLQIFVRGKQDFHLLLSESNTPLHAEDFSYEFGEKEMIEKTGLSLQFT